MSHITYVKTSEPILETHNFLKSSTLYPIANSVSATNNNTPNIRQHSLFQGDNLLTLTLLQASHQQKVDVIYIDPPYNTKNNDFTYSDNYSAQTDKHSLWLSLMERRLILARNLLKEDGYICVSIDNNEGFHLKLLMDKVFGENNFVDSLIWVNNKPGRSLSKHISHQYEFIHMYAKNKKKLVIAPEKKNVSIDDKEFKYSDNISRYAISRSLMNGHPTRFNIFTRPNLAYAIYYNQKNGHALCRDEKTVTGDAFVEPDQTLLEQGYIRILPKHYDTIGYGCFRWSRDKFTKEYTTNIIFKKDSTGHIYPYTKSRIHDNIKEVKRQSIIEISGNGAGTDLREVIGKNFPYPKPVKLIQHIISMHPNKNAVVLDFFAGSGTTGQAVLELNHTDNGNRTFILATSNEDDKENQHNIAQSITSDRINRVITGNWITPSETTRAYSDDNFTSYHVTTGTIGDAFLSFVENFYDLTLQPANINSHTLGYEGHNDKMIVFVGSNVESIELADSELLETLNELSAQAKKENKVFIFFNPANNSIIEDMNTRYVTEKHIQDVFADVIDNSKQQIV